MNQKHLGILGLIIILLFGATITALLVITNRVSNSLEKQMITLTFIDVGFPYSIRNRQLDIQETLSSGNLIFEKGTELTIELLGNDFFRGYGFLINNEKVNKIYKEAFNDPSVIQAIIDKTPYLLALEKIEASNIKVLNVDDLWRSQRLSHSLTYVQVSSLPEILELVKEKNLGYILHFRGRFSGHGWVWEYWDYFFFLENEIVYWFKQDI